MPVSLDAGQAEIVSRVKQEFLTLGVVIQDRDLRSAQDGQAWSIWIEQEEGFNTNGDPFVVNLEDLMDGVDYFLAVGYHVRRWVTYKKNIEDLKNFNSRTERNHPILIVDDDKGDCYLIARALNANFVENNLVTASNGEELLDYLHNRGKFNGDSPVPCLILLDLNMPRMDGREALKMVKNDEALRQIPIVILSTSNSGEEINRCYQNGANSYIVKPSSFPELVEAMRSLQNYWLSVVKLPFKENHQN